MLVLYGSEQSKYLLEIRKNLHINEIKTTKYINIKYFIVIFYEMLTNVEKLSVKILRKYNVEIRNDSAIINKYNVIIVIIIIVIETIS